MLYRVLVVEDDAAIRFGIARHLERAGFRVAEAETCAAARERFVASDPHVVVTDFRLPDGEAMDLIKEFRRQRPRLPIVVLTGYGTIELAVHAVKNGAHNFLTKPVDLDELVEELRRACQRSSTLASGVRLAAPAILNSDAMRGVRDDIERLRDVECSLLILGETGTGKTVLARWLHDTSRRRAKPFVDLNCAGLARDLVESELFGHERGAFTSAHAAKTGMFERADGGTLFLDEIGDIDPAVQPKLLKAIEEKRFRRMGSVHEQTVDVRIVAATHRDLREAVRASTFRADLYYRLSAMTVTVPALRHRPVDIPVLARDLIQSLADKLGRPTPTLSTEADRLLVAHSWPGNIRELKNVLERAMHLADGDVIGAGDLRVEPPGVTEGTPQESTLREMERTQIERALAAHGSVSEAARRLGISRSSMYLKVREYGLAPTRSSAPRMKTGSTDGS